VADRASFVLAFALALTGCTENHHGGFGGAVPAGASVVKIQTGAGVTIQPGVQAGYGITASQGTSFRIVWTGDAGASGTYREFWGSVWTNGTFDSVTPGCAGNFCALEADDYVSPVIQVSNGQRIDWDTFATTGLDGFDFTATAEPIYFDMVIDGVSYPELTIFVDGTTGQLASAPTLPFGLITQ
jgi:hypothetical protein